MSGVEMPARAGQAALSIRKGAAQAVEEYVKSLRGTYPPGVAKTVLRLKVLSTFNGRGITTPAS